jgi:hypothetical protein
MRRRILLFVLTAFALLAGATAIREGGHPTSLIPWCPPFCSK